MAEDKNTIEVERKVLEDILGKIKDLEKARENDSKMIDKLTEDNKMLLGIADKKRLADYEIKNNNGTLIKTAKVWLYDGKFILGWKMVSNRVVANLHRGIVESEQTIKLKLQKTVDPKEGTEEKIVLYKEFIDQKVSEEGDVIRVISEEESTFYKIQLKDGREVEVDVKYLN